MSECRRCGLTTRAAIAGVLCDPPHGSSHDFPPPSLPAQPRRPKETEMVSERLSEADIEALCEEFHDAYERAAVGAGWETQERSRKPWSDVPEANKATMRATISAVSASPTVERILTARSADMEAQRDAASMRSGEWARRNWNASADMKARIRDALALRSSHLEALPDGFKDRCQCIGCNMARALLDAAPAGGAE